MQGLAFGTDSVDFRPRLNMNSGNFVFVEKLDYLVAGSFVEKLNYLAAGSFVEKLNYLVGGSFMETLNYLVAGSFVEKLNHLVAGYFDSQTSAHFSYVLHTMIETLGIYAA